MSASITIHIHTNDGHTAPKPSLVPSCQLVSSSQVLQPIVDEWLNHPVKYYTTVEEGAPWSAGQNKAPAINVKYIAIFDIEHDTETQVRIGGQLVPMNYFTMGEPLLPELAYWHEIIFPAGTRFKYIETHGYFRDKFSTKTKVIGGMVAYDDGMFEARFLDRAGRPLEQSSHVEIGDLYVGHTSDSLQQEENISINIA